MKPNYETVSAMWEKIIDGYHLTQLKNQEYDQGIKQALAEANQMIQQQGWDKEEFYREMGARTG